jgi:hypothetical protein
MGEMVPNPLHAALSNALRAAEPLLEEIEKAIEVPYHQFHSGKVWSGRAAQSFDGQLAYHRGRVRASGEKILAELRQTLAHTPPKVTPEEAKTIAARYDMP